MYNGHYKVISVPPMVLHAKIHSAADRFMVSELQTYAKNQFLSDIQESQRTPEEFCEVITVVYTTTPPNLRDIVVQACCDQISRLSGNGTFKNMLRQPNTVDFAADLCKALADEVMKRPPE